MNHAVIGRILFHLIEQPADVGFSKKSILCAHYIKGLSSHVHYMRLNR